jgi:hypothetical protein
MNVSKHSHMTTLNKHKYITKGISMDIISTQISINLTKTQMTAILAEAMDDPVANQAIKRILNPFISESFPQFPQHTVVLLGETTEEGTECILKQPRVVAPRAERPAPEQSMDAMEEHSDSDQEDTSSEPETEDNCDA